MSDDGTEFLLELAVTSDASEAADGIDELASSAEKAAGSVDKLTASMDKAAEAADKTSTSGDKAAASMDKVAASADEAAGANDKAAAAMAAGATAADEASASHDLAAESILGAGAAADLAAESNAGLATSHDEASRAATGSAAATDELTDATMAGTAATTEHADAVTASGAALDDTTESIAGATAATAAHTEAVTTNTGALTAHQSQVVSSGSALDDTTSGITAQTAALNAHGAAAEKSGKKLEKASKVGRDIILGGVAVAGDAVYNAAKFQSLGNQLESGAGVSAKNLPTVEKGILQLADQTGDTDSDLMSSAYMVGSAGFDDPKQMLDIVRASTEAATETGASAGDVGDAVTSILHDYHLSGTKATGVSNALVETVSRGKMHMGDLAEALPTVIPIAEAQHIGYQQILGAIATQTAGGTSADEAAIQTRALIQGITGMQGSAGQSAEAEQLGLDPNKISSDIGKAGLTGTLDTISKGILKNMGASGSVELGAMNKNAQQQADLKTEMANMTAPERAIAEKYASGGYTATTFRTAYDSKDKGVLTTFASNYDRDNNFSKQLQAGLSTNQTYTTALKTLLGTQTGEMAALQLVGSNKTALDSNIAAISKSSKDNDVVQGWATYQKTFNAQMKEAEESLKSLDIEFGQVLMPDVEKGLHALEDVGHYFEKNKGELEALIAVLGTVGAAFVAAFAYSKIKNTISHLQSAVSDIKNMGSKISNLFGGGSSKTPSSTDSAANPASTTEQTEATDPLIEAGTSLQEAASALIEAAEKLSMSGGLGGGNPESDVENNATRSAETDAEGAGAGVGEDAGVVGAGGLAAKGAGAGAEGAEVAGVGAEGGELGGAGLLAGAGGASAILPAAIAGYAGYKIGSALNKHFHISDHAASGIEDVLGLKAKTGIAENDTDPLSKAALEAVKKRGGNVDDEYLHDTSTGKIVLKKGTKSQDAELATAASKYGITSDPTKAETKKHDEIKSYLDAMHKDALAKTAFTGAGGSDVGKAELLASVGDMLVKAPLKDAKKTSSNLDAPGLAGNYQGLFPKGTGPTAAQLSAANTAGTKAYDAQVKKTGTATDAQLNLAGDAAARAQRASLIADAAKTKSDMDKMTAAAATGHSDAEKLSSVMSKVESDSRGQEASLRSGLPQIVAGLHTPVQQHIEVTISGVNDPAQIWAKLRPYISQQSGKNGGSGITVR
jgi:TP901 family phage tail tape measure protein